MLVHCRRERRPPHLKLIAKVRSDWDEIDSFLFPNRNIARVRILKSKGGSLAAWENRSLAELVEARGGHPSDVLADWLLENDLETEFIVPMSNIDPHAVGSLANEPEVIISGSDAGAHFQMFCGVGDSTLLLTRHVREYGHISLVEAVRKLTSEQADLIGLADRGRIAVGARADITVFALEDLAWLPEQTVSDLPGGRPRLMRPPGNFRYTLVNGIVVQKDGEVMPERPGSFIRKQESLALASAL